MKHTIKKAAVIAAAVMTFIMLFSFNVFAKEASDAQQLMEALGEENCWINDSGALCLKADIELRESVVITGGEIQINGASCIISGEGDFPLFIIKDGTLILGNKKNTDNEETLILTNKNAPAFVAQGGELVIYNGTLIENCTSESDGGAVNVQGGTVYFLGGVIDGCVSEGDGGAVALESGTLAISGCQFRSCKAVNGGAVAIKGGELVMQNCIIGSEVKEGELSGDVDYNEEDGNTAEKLGGGVFFGENAGEFALGDGFTINGNSSDVGGGIYISSGCTISVGKSSVYNNKASYGAGIYNKGLLTLDTPVVAHNEAELGGGVYNDQNATLTITDATVDSNYAEYFGGGIINAGTAYQNGGAVNYNEAHTHSAGVYNEGSYTLNAGSLGYNKIKDSNGDTVDGYGTEMLNCGELIMENEVFVGGENDIALNYNGSAIKLNGPFTTTTTIARLTVVKITETSEPQNGLQCSADAVLEYCAGEAEGFVLLTTADAEDYENKSGMKYYSTLFKVVTDETGGEWTVDSDGKLSKKPMDAKIIIALCCFGAAAAAGAVFAVKMRAKKK